MTSIILDNVCLDFPIYNAQSFSFRHMFVKNVLGGVLKKQNKSTILVSALKNISFSLQYGDRLGLIGHNGAGKSTLLKLLAGIYTPTSGKITTQGKIATLFDMLWTTYDDLTGYENLYISSVARGQSFSEAKASLTHMGEFTDLGDFLHVPMRTYSAGMRVRIGFAVATEGTPDILLIDEVFGAGDKGFVDKSIERLTSLIDRAGILVFSSHSEALLSQLCNKLMILEHGEIKAFGNTKEILALYKDEKQPKKRKAS